MRRGKLDLVKYNTSTRCNSPTNKPLSYNPNSQLVLKLILVLFILLFSVKAGSTLTDISNVAQIYQTGENTVADSETSIGFDQELTVQSNFTHGNASLAFNEAGWYKVSYACNFRETSGADRIDATVWLENSTGAEIVPSRSYAYIRYTTHDGDTDSAQGVVIVNMNANDNLTLRAENLGGGGTGLTTNESCWMYAEKVNRPVVQIYETTSYDDILNTTPVITQDFGATTYEDTGNFTVDLTNNWITVDETGWYKLYYVASSEKTDGIDDNARRTPTTYLYVNDSVELEPSMSYSYHKRSDEGKFSSEQGFTMAYLSAGTNISMRRYTSENENISQATQTRNETWLLIERLLDDNILFLWDTTGGQTATSGNAVEGEYINITWDTQEQVGENFSHTSSQSNFTINETGVFEISYSVGWDLSAGGGRTIGCARLIQNGVAVEPSKQCSWQRGSTNTLASAGANFVVNNTAGDEYKLQHNVRADTGDAMDLEPDSTWITVMPVKIMTAEAAGTWADTDFDRCMNITISNSGSETLTNFPAYINLTHDNDDMLPDFSDIRFYNEGCSNGGEELDYEIENYTYSTRAHIWARIPSLTSSGTTISVYYKNNTGVNSGENASGVWDVNYTMVQHLEESCATGNCTLDSTSNQNNGTPYSSTTITNLFNDSGIIGPAYRFDGSNDHVEMEDDATLKPSEISVCGWFIMTGAGDGQAFQGVISKETWDDTGYVISIEESGDYNITWRVMTTNSGSDYDVNWTGDVLQWHSYCGTFDGTISKIYVDGVLSTTYSGATLSHDTKELVIGVDAHNYPPGQGFFEGLVDEVRISNTNRSANWVNQSYLIVANHTDYVSYDNEQVRPGSWADINFDKCMNITINNSGSETLTNFPAYINLTHDNDDMLPDFTDIRFYSSDCNNGGTELDYEIENYTYSTRAHIWARIPSLTSSGTTISVYYKNNTGVNSGENASGVWDNKYAGVWHMTETNATDSTSNQNNGTEGGTLTQVSTGKVDGGTEYAGNDDYISIPDNANLRGMSNLTLEVWLKFSSDDSDSGYILRKMDWAGGSNYYYYSILHEDDNQIQFMVYDDDDGSNDGTTTTDQWNSTHGWIHVMAVFESGTYVRIYVNGEQKAESTSTIISSINPNDHSIPLAVNAYYEEGSYYYKYFDGTMDELRVMTTAKSPNWINMSYLIVANHTDYVSFGSEESRSIGTVPSTSLNLPSNKNHSVSLTENITFNCSATDTEGLANITLYTNLNATAGWQAYQTKTLGGTSNSTIFTVNSSLLIGSNTFKDSSYVWNCYVNDSDGNSEWASSNNTFSGWDLGTYANITRELTSTDYIELVYGKEINGSETVTNLSDSLVFLYHFNNESAYGENGTRMYDFSGNENNGTCTGTTCPVWNSTSKFGGGYVFDGEDDRINTTVNINESRNWTFALWVYVDHNGTDAGDFIIDSEDSFVMYYNDPWERIQTAYANSTGDSRSGPMGPSGIIQYDTWYHVVFRYNGTHLSLFYDGELGNNLSVDDGIFDGDVSIHIGDASGNPLNGTMDEVAFWNRSLTEDEIRELYKRGNASKGEYTSKIYDAGSSSIWKNISWDEAYPYGEELPDSQGTESVSGGVNMDFNIVLYHFNNESGNGENGSRMLDYSGSGFNGSCTYCPTWNSTGWLGGAYEFDGVDDNITFDGDATMAARANGTVAAWVKIHDNGSTLKIWHTMDGRDRYIYSFNNTFYAGIYDGSTVRNISGGIVGKSWHHVVFTWDQTDSNITLYVDGESVESRSVSWSTVGSESGGTIGGYKSSGTGLPELNYLNGTVDEFALWNKSLNSDEILKIYKRGALRLNISARSCDDADCDLETWTDFGSNSTSTNISALSNNQYFQYKLTYDTINANYTPQLNTGSVTMGFGPESEDPPAVTLNRPANNNNSVSLTDNIIFNCSATDTGGLANITLYTNLNTTVGWQAYQTKALGGTDNSTIFTVDPSTLIGSNTFKDSKYKYNCLVNDTDGNSDWGDSNLTFSGWDLGTFANTTRELTSTDYIELVYGKEINTTETQNNLSQDLMILYHFNNESGYGENSTFVYDFSGNSRNATAYINDSSGEARGTDATGKFGRAYNFTGDHDYIQTTDVTDTVDNSAPWTYAFWFYVKGVGTDTADDLVNGGSHNPRIVFINSGDYIQIAYQNSTSDYKAIISNSDSTIERNKWNHLALTWNGSQIKLYLNGTFDTNGTINDGIRQTTASDIMIGGTNWGSNSLNGSIDEFAFWNRTLSADEIKLLFARGNASKGTYTSKIFDAGEAKSWKNISWDEALPYGEELPGNQAVETVSGGVDMSENVMLYHFNNNSEFGENDTKVYDFSGIGNNGTVTGGNATWTASGKFGGAYSFDGEGDYISIGETTYANYTVMMWFNYRESKSSTLFMRGFSGGCHYEPQVWISTDNYIHSKITGCSNVGYIGNGSVSNNTWYHVAVVVNTTGQSLYVDGIEVDSASKTSSTYLDSTMIGAWPQDDNGNASGGYFNGSIDEVAYFNRTLSSQEIMDVYKRGALKLNISARSCDDADCDLETWTDFGSNSTSTNISSLSENQYFQYKLSYETDNYNYTPQLNTSSVTIKSGDGDLLNVTINLSSNPVAEDENPVVHGHVSKSDGTDAANNVINIYVNNTPYYYNNRTGILENTTHVWWNTGWESRTLIDVESLISSDVGNMSTMINFSTSSLVSAGKMKNNCGDVRFANAEGKELEFTMDVNSCNSSNTFFWVWLNLTGNANTTIYAYYNNSGASLKTSYTNPDPTLLLYMHFDNNTEYEENSTIVHDFSGNDNNGTMGYGDEFINMTDGKFGGAAQFDGEDDYIRINDSADDSLDITGNLTIAAWFKVQKDQDYHTIVAKNYVYNEFYATVHDGNRITFFHGNGTDYNSETVYPLGYGSGINFSLDTWYHVVISRNTSSLQINFYFNGDLNGTSSYPEHPSPLASDYPITIGVRNLGLLRPMNGSIDELMIFNRTITPEEVEIIYNSTKDNYKGNFSVAKTNADGDYNYSFTLPNTSTTYEIKVNTTYDDTNGENTTILNVSDSPISTLNNPINNNNSVILTDNITFNCSATDTEGLANITLYTDLNTTGGWQAYQTKTLGGTANSTIFTVNSSLLIGNNTFKDSTFKWNCLVNDSDAISKWSNINYSFSGWNLGTYANTTLGEKLFLTTADLGSGNDGVLNVSSANTVINNYAYLNLNASANSSSIEVSNTNGLSAGDEILIIQMQNSTNGTAGVYEFADIQSISGNIITLKSTLSNSYYTGSYDIMNATVSQIVRVPQYTDVTIDSGASLTATAWDGYKGGIVVFRAKGVINISGEINVSGKGFRGGDGYDFEIGTDNTLKYGYQGESYTGKGNQSPSNKAGGGGGGNVSVHADECGSGGAGGSYGAAGSTGGFGSSCPGTLSTPFVGTTYGLANLSRIYLGSGGGGGATDDHSNESGFGGSGGGIIYISGKNLIVNDDIQARGTNGTQSSDCNDPGHGAGGSGGSIYLSARYMNIGTSLINASGGLGVLNDCETDWSGSGGNGSEGRVRIEYGSLTGSTDPSADELNFSNTGTYTSKIFNAGSSSAWKNISWDEALLYGEELPDNQAVESEDDGVNMTGNVLLFHFNNNSDLGENSTKVYDFSGSGNNGTLGDGKQALNSSGKFGGSIQLDGNSTYVNVSPSSTLDSIIDTNEVTISLWAKSDEDYTSFPDTYREFWQIWNSTTNRIYARIESDKDYSVYNDINNNGTSEYFGKIATNILEWNHYVWTLNETTIITYINGQVIASDALSQNLSTMNKSFRLRIGFGYTDIRIWNGSMDEVSIWNRSLSSDEIFNIYKRGALKLNISARSCDDADCDTETWTDFGSNSTSTNISSLSDNQYFQYKLSYETDNYNYTPRLDLNSVTVNYGAGSGSGGWANSELDRCMNITISNSGDETLTNFPAYINLTYDSEMLSDFKDIRFYSNACNNSGTLLDYEIENYTYSDRAHIWIRIPSLPSTGTVISIYYKNNTGVTSGEDAEGVWDSNYMAVWHMEEVNITDSTSNNNDGNESGGVTQTTTGKIDGANLFDGDDDRIEGYNVSIPENQSYTLSFWARNDRDDADATEDNIIYATNNFHTKKTATADQKDYTVAFYDGAGAGCHDGYEIPAAEVHNWVLHTFRYNDSAEAYNTVANAALDLGGQSCDGHLAMNWTTIGTNAGSFNGSLDEIRISNTLRSDNWINQSYHMMANQSDYVTFGNEQARSGWADTSMDNCMNITINNTGSETLTDFPAYINLTYDSDMLSDFKDIRFYSAGCLNGGTELDYEIENYTTSTRAHVWTRIPTLTTGNNVISVYYKNNTGITSGENAEGVWDSNFISVWHMTEINADDSTSYSDDGTQSGGVTQVNTGLVDGANDFDGEDDYIALTSTTTHNLSTGATFGFWLKKDVLSTAFSNIVVLGGDADYNAWIQLSDNGRIILETDTNNDVCYGDYIDDTNWHYYSFSVDNYDCNIFADDANITDTGDPSVTDNITFNKIAAAETPVDDFFNGSLDEIRISNTARSADWINMTYHIVENQDNIVNYGPEISYLNTCQDLDTANGIYMLSKNVNSSGTCFNVLANNITLDCQGYLINYTQSSVGYGINITAYNGTTIKNCIIVQNSSNEYAHAFFLEDTIGNKIINNSVNITSWYSEFIEIDTSDNNLVENNTHYGGYHAGMILSNSHNNTILNNILEINTGTCCGNDLIWITIGSSDNLIERNTLTSTQGNGIFISSPTSSGNNLTNNTILTDYFYSCEGIHLESAAYTEMKYNKINSSSCPALLVSGTLFNHSIDQTNLAEGLPILYNHSIDNKIVQDKDYTSTYGEIICANCTNITYYNITMASDGINFFETHNSTVQNSNFNSINGYGVWIYDGSDNSIDNNNITTSGYESLGIAITGGLNNNITNNIINGTGQTESNIMLYRQGGDLDVNSTFIANNKLYSNFSNGFRLRTTHFNTIVNNSYLSETSNGYVTGMGIFAYSSVGYNRFINLNITTNGENSDGIYTYGGAGSGNNTFRNLHINALGANSEGVVFQTSSANNTFYDSTITVGTGYPVRIRVAGENNFTNVSMSKTDLYFDGGATGKINVFWYMDVHVNDSNGNDVADATVNAWDNNSNLAFTNTTNSTGWITRQAVLSHWENDTLKFTYSNFTVNASKDTDENTTEVNMSTNKIVYLFLPAADTCTCPGAGSDWLIDMSDTCIITSACDITTGYLNFTGTGSVRFNNTINATNMERPGSGQTIFIDNNATLTIN